MAQTAQHRPMDALLPDVQEATLPVGAAGRPSGQLQGGPRSGHGAEETVPQGGDVLSCADGRRAARLRARVPRPGEQRRG